MSEKITLSLSTSQRNLLLKYEPFFADHDLFRLISVAIKKGKHYEISLEDSQLEDLLDQIAELSNHEEDEEIQNQLDDLCGYLETFSDTFEENPYCSEYSRNTGAVYTLKVALEGTPQIWRKIAIRGGQTLEDLHNIIFHAFDRDDEHLYSFYIPTRPLKSRPRRIYDVSIEYTHPFNYEERGGFDDNTLNAATTSIESLKLTEKQKLFYLFDFGDSWWHTITVEGADGKADNRKYPCIIERNGQSPPQYEYPDEKEEKT